MIIKLTNFYIDLGVQKKFISIVHPQAKGKVESVNILILKGLNKKLDDDKGLWEELLHEMLWSYHTTPHSTTKETLLAMVYGTDAMIPVEIDTPFWWRSQFNDETNKAILEYAPDLIDKLRKVTHVLEFTRKHRAAKRYNSMVIPWDI